jgi:hypothetical protein
MKNKLTGLVSLLDFFPGVKTKVSAIAALALAAVQGWNQVAVAFNIPAVVEVPDVASAAVLALLGLGAANAQDRIKDQIDLNK